MKRMTANIDKILSSISSSYKSSAFSFDFSQVQRVLLYRGSIMRVLMGLTVN